MLGSELLLRVPPGWEAVGTDLAPQATIAGLDLADEAALEKAWLAHGPFDGVLHCAAYTAVDNAERERELAERVNVVATRALASACARHGARMVAVSTDFVFDGQSTRPYVESDEPRPLSVYGVTKLAGERALLDTLPRNSAVVRTQWLYGPRGKHFPRTIASLARERGALRVVDDQTGAPTTTLELAPALWDVLASDATGIFHAACEGSCTWFGFTQAILAELDLTHVRLEPCSTDAFPRPARRPAYSVLDSSRLALLRGRRLAPWRDALKAYLEVERP
jgi:dTDP-4-dehydrorhamnose reductase